VLLFVLLLPMLLVPTNHSLLCSIIPSFPSLIISVPLPLLLLLVKLDTTTFIKINCWTLWVHSCCGRRELEILLLLAITAYAALLAPRCLWDGANTP
jgi:hypothetical protein